MRDVKFRAWDKDNKQMVYFDEAEKPFHMAGILFRILPPVRLPCGFEELMQYTGLKDKNGKEIYEGDLVKGLGEMFGNSHNVKPCYVAWDEEYAMFFPMGWKGNHLIDFDLEVIGNIYENPELLKEEK